MFLLWEASGWDNEVTGVYTRRADAERDCAHEIEHGERAWVEAEVLE